MSTELPFFAYSRSVFNWGTGIGTGEYNIAGATSNGYYALNVTLNTAGIGATIYDAAAGTSAFFAESRVAGSYAAYESGVGQTLGRLGIGLAVGTDVGGALYGVVTGDYAQLRESGASLVVGGLAAAAAIGVGQVEVAPSLYSIGSSFGPLISNAIFGAENYSPLYGSLAIVPYSLGAGGVSLGTVTYTGDGIATNIEPLPFFVGTQLPPAATDIPSNVPWGDSAGWERVWGSYSQPNFTSPYVSPVVDQYGLTMPLGGGNSLLDLYNSGALTAPSANSAPPLGTEGSLQQLDPTTGQPIGSPVSWQVSPTWAAEAQYFQDFAQQLQGYDAQVNSWTQGLNNWVDSYAQAGSDGLQFQRSLDPAMAQARADYNADPAQQNYDSAPQAGYFDSAQADQLFQANSAGWDGGLFAALGDAFNSVGNAFGAASSSDYGYSNDFGLSDGFSLTPFEASWGGNVFGGSFSGGSTGGGSFSGGSTGGGSFGGGSTGGGSFGGGSTGGGSFSGGSTGGGSFGGGSTGGQFGGGSWGGWSFGGGSWGGWSFGGGSWGGWSFGGGSWGGWSFGGGSWGGWSFGGGYWPVVLDLTGGGIKITPKSSSNTFFDMAGDGYQHRTAWAGAGNAVLVLDTNNDGKITQQNQIVFTDWDPTATNDLQALRNVFDTNHDGKLDAGDAKFSEFKLLVTNTDGTQTLETLAQAGIASIDLIADSTKVALPDGSSIDGQTSYTRTDGSTGTAATVTFAYDAFGNAIAQTIVHNPDGSTTIDNKQIGPNGSLAGETVSTTSADGKSRTLTFDDNGDGVIDRIQTDVTSTNADGSTTEALTDKTGAGVLLDSTTTITSADGKLTTISRDTNGDGLIEQKEVWATNTDGSKSIVVSDLNPDNSLKDQSTVITSADGLIRTSKTDYDGDGVFDLTRVDATVVNADGSRIETIVDANADGSVRDKTVTTLGAAGLPKTVQSDYNADGVFDLTSVSSVVVNADGSTTTTTIETNADSSLRDRSIVTLGADGLSKTTSADITGDGTLDVTTTDVTVVNADGGRTETIQDFNANGSLRDKSVVAKGADGRSRVTQIDQNGDGNWDRVETIVLAANGVSTDTASSFNADGTLISRTTTTTSADGLSKSIAVDANGDGIVDLTTTEVAVGNTDGSSTTTRSDFSGNGSLRDKVVTTTSANGSSQTIQTDRNGDGTVDLVASDTIVVNADGSRTETSTIDSSNGKLLSQTVSAIMISLLPSTIRPPKGSDH